MVTAGRGVPGWLPAALTFGVAFGTLLASPGPLLAQRSAAGEVSVRVPVVSELEVERVAAPAVDDDGAVRVFRLRVRANRRWQVRVTAPDAERTVWVRTSNAGDAGEYRRLDPGGVVSLATGGRGLVVIEVQCRWQRGAGAPDPALVYTLGEPGV